jgi:hypothetical protein
MKQKVLWLLLIMAIASASWAGWTGRAQGTPRNSWEYKVVPVTDDGATVLNDLGTEGWELVTIRTQEQSAGNVRYVRGYYYFKRPR